MDEENSNSYSNREVSPFNHTAEQTPINTMNCVSELDDGEFAYALKSLMKKDLIEFRKGNLHFKPNVIIRYKNREL